MSETSMSALSEPSACRPLITMLTDFGTDSHYVAAMKGVILGWLDATLVDISHAVAPQDVLQGAFLLSEVYECFPRGTVHLVVVDPGVGTSRRLLAAEGGGYRFVGPDNGLFSLVRDRLDDWRCRELSNPEVRRAEVSSTFHGRDLMAPAAAYLAAGGFLDDLGPSALETVRLAMPSPRILETYPPRIEGCVIYQDAFGNLITNIDQGHLEGTPNQSWSLEVGGTFVSELVQTYGEQSPGQLVALIGSTGRVEVAVVNGHAGHRLGIGPGTRVGLVAQN